MAELQIDPARVRWAVDGAPASEAEALAALADRPLLVLMHGYGSFEGDLIELAPLLPPAVCASPRAPLVAPAPVENGYAWFPLSFGAQGLAHDPVPARFAGTAPHAAAVAALDWIDGILDRAIGAGAERRPPVALFGFSQGGAMVTSLLRLRPGGFAAGVICSGFVPAGTFEGDRALAAARPPVFWGRDVEDPVIDAARIARTAEWLPEHTALVRREYTGILHGIGRDELGDIAAFLRPLLAAERVPAASTDGSDPR
ncbi:alpha/beta hydrolase [Leucobacter sp. HNU]|uniref:alpha/beta hydrolase n=1 Tax=Leucobacter sp. HNU TaxID=3236805 RepID=UPI003A7FC75A